MDAQESTEEANRALIAEVTSIIDEIEMPSSEADVEISVRHLQGEQQFVALLGEWEIDDIRYSQIGSIRYSIQGEHDVDIFSTYLRPEFRGRGITAEFLADVIDELGGNGTRVTQSCPVAAAYVTASSRT